MAGLVSATRCIFSSKAASKTLSLLSATHQRTGCTRNLYRNAIFERSFTTKTDQSLVKHLAAQLKLERQTIDPLPTTLSKFKVSIFGSQALLSHDMGNEKINITMDVNSRSIEEDSDDEIYSYPSFLVSITRENGSTLELDCSVDGYSTDEEDFENDKIFERFIIDNVTVIPEGHSKDNLITMSTESLNEDILETLYEYLEERGVDDDFATRLVNLHGKLEQEVYVEFLEKLKSFVETS